jgi:hypothetical protein
MNLLENKNGNEPTLKLVNIEDIKAGDTISYNGQWRTVCNSDIKIDDFMGLTIFGDSFRLGKVPVTKVIFKRW